MTKIHQVQSHSSNFLTHLRIILLTTSLIVAMGFTSGTATAAPAQIGPKQELGPGGGIVAVSGLKADRRCIGRRGISKCGPLVGAAIQYGTSPEEMENKFGRLGIHRYYWRADQVDSALRSARNDLKHGRLPWISFKLPHSWDDMANGRGDAWARNLAKRLSKLPGPVWVAFHHEPEGDGNMADWTRMQERLGPIVRKNAKNVGFTVILIGWNTLYGPNLDQRLVNVYPDTKVDVLGIDAYDAYQVTRNGYTTTSHTDMASQFFKPIARFAKARNTHWGVAETGYTHAAAADQPNWLRKSFRAMKKYNGVALTYYNSSMHSVADWRLTTGRKIRDYELVRSQGFLMKPRR